MTELTDEERAKEIEERIRNDSLKNLEETEEKVRQAIGRTIRATMKANYQCDASFCVSWGIHLWYVCDLTGLVIGPYEKQEAHDIEGLINQVLKG